MSQNDINNVTEELKGLATLAEVTDDYVSFRSSSLTTVRQAQAIAERLEEEYGIPVMII